MKSKTIKNTVSPETQPVEIKQAQRMTECAVMLALGTVLSMVPIIKLPFGGSVTLLSMVPLIVISNRFGIIRGFLTGLLYGAIQMLFDTSVFSYATGWKAVTAIVLLDYLVAFAVIGLSGIFRKIHISTTTTAVSGAVFACILRYICHVITGCTVWAGVSIPSADGLVYSLAYNAVYMLPETIFTAAAVYWLFGAIDFSSPSLKRMKREHFGTAHTTYTLLAAVSAAATAVADTALVVASQAGESFDVTLLKNIDFKLFILVTVAGVVLCDNFRLRAKISKNNIKQKNKA